MSGAGTRAYPPHSFPTGSLSAKVTEIHSTGEALGANGGVRGAHSPRAPSCDHGPPTVVTMGRGDLATLVRICDPAGRTRGTGFLADHHGTVVTSHEAVDGLSRVLLRAPGDRSWLAEAGAVTPLPESGLALVRSEGLGVRPCRSPPAPRSSPAPTSGSRPTAGARRASSAPPPSRTPPPTASTTSTRPSPSPSAPRAPRPPPRRPGRGEPRPRHRHRHRPRRPRHRPPRRPQNRRIRGPAPARRSAHRPAAAQRRHRPRLRPRPQPRRDPRTRRHLHRPRTGPRTLARARRTRRLRPRTRPLHHRAGPVLALVGAPGTGRTTALAALCARRAGARPRPHRPAARRRPARRGPLPRRRRRPRPGPGRPHRRRLRSPGDTTTATPSGPPPSPGRPAGRSSSSSTAPRDAPLLAHRLPAWTAATERWLRAHGVRLATACRPEHWERAGALYGPEALHRPATGDDATGDDGSGYDGAGYGGAGLPGRRPRPVHRGGGPGRTGGYGLRETDLAEADARHPLALRLLAEVRAALPGGAPGQPCREEVFTAHLDLVCLRTAVRIAAGILPRSGGPPSAGSPRA